MKKKFEVSVIELVDFKYIIVCICRSSDIDFWIFKKKLELIIRIIHSRNKRIIICGEWNLNFMQDDIRLQKVQIEIQDGDSSKQR